MVLVELSRIGAQMWLQYRNNNFLACLDEIWSQEFWNGYNISKRCEIKWLPEVDVIIFV